MSMAQRKDNIGMSSEMDKPPSGSTEIILLVEFLLYRMERV